MLPDDDAFDLGPRCGFMPCAGAGSRRARVLLATALAALASSACGRAQPRAQAERALQSTLALDVRPSLSASLGEPLRTPVAPDERPRAPRGLRMHIEDWAGRPCPGVRTDVWLESGSQHSGVSDESGVLWLPVPCDEVVRYAEARPEARLLARHAHRFGPEEQTSCVEDVRDMTLRITPGGGLRVTAIGPDGEPLPWQVIVAQLQSEPAAGNAYASETLTADARGFVDVSHLPTGVWSLLGEAGRGYDQTDRLEVELTLGGIAECSLRFEALPDEDYVALRFPELAGGECNELFHSAAYHVEIQGWQALHPIGGDGSFFSWDRDSMSLRVVDGDFHRVSQWLEVRRGDRTTVPELRWGPVESGHWSTR